ncbi:hypothetical protein Syun_015005 [Stephania yunnanensis]|uniref:Nodulin-like domain-containing protein n=1 Tax=Stephania yunnanensis TaxID=152371 RepID=A0AAP0JMK4_9MAGN
MRSGAWKLRGTPRIKFDSNANNPSGNVSEAQGSRLRDRFQLIHPGLIVLAVLVTCMRNFRKNRGPVSGILKGYVGLTTTIFADLCSALFSNRPSSFLHMLAIVPGIVITTVVFLREVPDTTVAASAQNVTESHYFNIFNTLAVIIALYLLVFNMTGDHCRTLSIMLSRPHPFHLSIPLDMYSAMQYYYLTGDIKHQIQDLDKKLDIRSEILDLLIELWKMKNSHCAKIQMRS